MRAPKTSTAVRREQIAEAALALFGASDGKEPSIAGIARRVGVAPSAVYRHYRGKDAILAAALERVERRLQENIALARQDRSTADPLARLRGLFMRHAEMLAANPGAPQVLLTRGVFGPSKTRRQKVAGVMMGYLGEVSQIISEGQQLGGIRVDLEPRTAALVFLGMLLPAVVLREISEGTFDVAEHARKVWPALQAALQATPTAGAGTGAAVAGARGQRKAGIS